MAVSADSLLPHRWPGEPLPGVLVERPNRFLARCIVGAQTISAHVPDRGRCLDLLVPGQEVIVVAAPARDPARAGPARMGASRVGESRSGESRVGEARIGAPPLGPTRAGRERTTAFTLLLARAKTAPSPWVSIDPAGASRLVAAAIDGGLLDVPLGGARVQAREVSVDHGGERSRIDLLLTDGTLCEVKSVGAARGGVALFPDAPTLRGVRHLALLAARARRGLPAAVVFCAQREDALAVAPDFETDPGFARALDRAASAGVRLLAIACSAEPRGMRLLGIVPVLR